ncbi:hypothetical protein CM49_06565 [Paenibacillus sp. P1XP2]|nr:hypothetical protein CM49_06565 [Paenibacillus sp. P1XP2]
MNFIDPEPLRCFETNGFSQMINVDTKNIADRLFVHAYLFGDTYESSFKALLFDIGQESFGTVSLIINNVIYSFPKGLVTFTTSISLTFNAKSYSLSANW